VAARAAAARRGGARSGPAEAGKRRARCRRGTWRGEERRRVAGAREMVGEGSGVGAERNRERRELEVDEGDLAAIFQKCRDSTVKLG
jgi:hypothetical protein